MSGNHTSATLQLPQLPPSRDALDGLFRTKYGDPARTGWSPRRRYQNGYFLPADIYEAVVAQLVTSGCRWIDVGGGHNIFPDNPGLAKQLVARTSRTVAVDPDATTHKNDLVHERVQAFIEDYRSTEPFDLATLRMVAEHITEPDRAAASLERLVKTDGLVVVFTVNLWAPITTMSRLTPFWVHYPVKRFIWGGDEEDTFPVAYKMNTRAELRRLFADHHFREVAFAYLDDLSALGRFNFPNRCELLAWRVCRALRVNYPENCLLGIYQRRVSS
jgi:2-polyprenyl-3-methyl-5-hydroxy-6-metoxy-1,4-benzoquinol methylase